MSFFHLKDSVSSYFYRGDGQEGLLLILEIIKTSQIVRATDGKAYVRRGASNQPISTPEQLKQLELAKGVSSHEDATVRDEVDNIRDFCYLCAVY